MTHRLVAAALAALGLATGASADWKPAAGPLMTRWAKDVSPENVWLEYPRPQMVRKEWQNLNGLWQFAITGESQPPPIGKDLPEQILVPFPVESALSGVMKRAERIWYRRTFNVDNWLGGQKRILLHFGAVDWETTVWVNGQPVGSHRGGYDPFTFDITAALQPAGEQELVVGVTDPTDKHTQPRGKQAGGRPLPRRAQRRDATDLRWRFGLGCDARRAGGQDRPLPLRWPTRQSAGGQRCAVLTPRAPLARRASPARPIGTPQRRAPPRNSPSP